MSDRLTRQPPASPSRRPLLFRMWGRETVKDLTLILFAVPVIASLMYVPVVAGGDGSWPRLLALLVLFAAIWWILHLILRRWVASGRRAGGSGDGAGGNGG